MYVACEPEQEDAGLLPSLPAERYACAVVRMVDAEPTAAIKAALVRQCAVDARLLTQPLIDGAHSDSHQACGRDGAMVAEVGVSVDPSDWDRLGAS
jgi:hypothetical protein